MKLTELLQGCRTQLITENRKNIWWSGLNEEQRALKADSVLARMTVLEFLELLDRVGCFYS